MKQVRTDAPFFGPFASLTTVDYGDAGYNVISYIRTLEEIRRITREIVETGAVSFTVGGDHSIPNATFRGVVDVYGMENVAFVHFDAHLDRSAGKFGGFCHSGSYMTPAVQEGLVRGDQEHRRLRRGRVNPYYDNKGQQTARLVRRVMLTFLTGMAIKKDGIAPDFVHPRVSGRP